MGKQRESIFADKTRAMQNGSYGHDIFGVRGEQ
jgi:hypothetical protein